MTTWSKSRFGRHARAALTFAALAFIALLAAPVVALAQNITPALPKIEDVAKTLRRGGGCARSLFRVGIVGILIESGGFYTASNTFLTTGAHNITAKYLATGDINYKATTSSILTQTILVQEGGVVNGRVLMRPPETSGSAATLYMSDSASSSR